MRSPTSARVAVSLARLFIVGAALFNAAASAATVDLAITAQVKTAPPYRVGQPIEVDLIVTNRSAVGTTPTQVLPPINVVSWTRVDASNRLPSTLRPIDESLCFIEYVSIDPLPGERTGTIHILYLAGLVAGASRTCRIELYPLVENPSPAVFGVTSVLDADPVAANNEVAVAIPTAALPVPVDAFGAMLVLSGLLWLFGRRAVRRASMSCNDRGFTRLGMPRR